VIWTLTARHCIEKLVFRNCSFGSVRKSLIVKTLKNYVKEVEIVE
jgi:hypothetical protein